jgi:hypothetical protein
MSAAVILLALSAATGFAVGTSFSWFAILISSSALAGLSAAALHIAGFDALPGIANYCYLFDRAAARLRYGRGLCTWCFGGSQEITPGCPSKGLAPLELAS